MTEKKKKIDSSQKVEREYVIPLREKCRPVPRYKKANKAIKTIKEFLVKHMQIRDRDLKKIKLDLSLNEAVWARGIKKPPHKIKVKAVKENGVVTVNLVETPEKIKYRKARIEKRENKGKEVAEKKKTLMQKAKEEKEKQSQEKKESVKTEEVKEIETKKEEVKTPVKKKAVAKKTVEKKAVKKTIAKKKVAEAKEAKKA